MNNWSTTILSDHYKIRMATKPGAKWTEIWSSGYSGLGRRKILLVYDGQMISTLAKENTSLHYLLFLEDWPQFCNSFIEWGKRWMR